MNDDLILAAERALIAGFALALLATLGTLTLWFAQ